MASIRAVGELPLGIDGLHVQVLGQPPIEQHWLADIRRDAFSVSKTFTSVAVGIAQASSGIVYRWEDPDADHDGDAALDILTTALLAEPGTTFAYRGSSSYLFSRIIHPWSGWHCARRRSPDWVPPCSTTAGMPIGGSSHRHTSPR